MAGLDPPWIASDIRIVVPLRRRTISGFTYGSGNVRCLFCQQHSVSARTWIEIFFGSSHSYISHMWLFSFFFDRAPVFGLKMKRNILKLMGTIAKWFFCPTFSVFLFLVSLFSGMLRCEHLEKSTNEWRAQHENQENYLIAVTHRHHIFRLQLFFPCVVTGVSAIKMFLSRIHTLDFRAAVTTRNVCSLFRACVCPREKKRILSSAFSALQSFTSRWI